MWFDTLVDVIILQGQNVADPTYIFECGTSVKVHPQLWFCAIRGAGIQYLLQHSYQAAD